MDNQKTPINITPASAVDAEALADLFIGHITAHPEYISHGEVQTGIGEVSVQDGCFVAHPTSDAREKWIKGFLEMLSNDALVGVWKAVDDKGTLMGFCIAYIEEAGGAPFGMVGDVLVNPQCRAAAWATPCCKPPSTGYAQRVFRTFIWNLERTTTTPTVSSRNADSSMSARCIN